MSRTYSIRSARNFQAHEAAILTIVAKPENDPTRQKETIDANAAIEAAKTELLAEESRIAATTARRAALAQQITTVDRVSGRLDNLNRQIQSFFTDSEADLATLSLSSDQILQVKADKTPLAGKRDAIVEERKRIDLDLDPANTEGLVQAKTRIEARIQDLQKRPR